MPLKQENFEKYIDKSGECWLWIGKTRHRGYGKFSWRDETGALFTRYAHRIAWFFEHGEWPPVDLVVCHRCDTPLCVRPAHLWLGSQSENIRDCVAKGRHRNQYGLTAVPA